MNKRGISKKFMIVTIVALPIILFGVFFLIFGFNNTIKDIEKGEGISRIEISEGMKAIDIRMDYSDIGDKEIERIVLVLEEDKGTEHEYAPEDVEDRFRIYPADFNLKDFKDLRKISARYTYKIPEQTPPRTSTPNGSIDAQNTNQSHGCISADQCSDGINCTLDRCINGRCMYAAMDERCSDGLYCNGIEYCNISQGCKINNTINCTHLSVGCSEGYCNESTDACAVKNSTRTACSNSTQNTSECSSPSQCDDGIACTRDRCTYGSCTNSLRNESCPSNQICTVNGCIATATGCNTCSDCDNVFEECSSALCHDNCSGSAPCFFTAASSGSERCIEEDYACAFMINACADYPQSECNNDPCRKGCEWANNQCRAKTVDTCQGIYSCPSYQTQGSCIGDVCEIGDCEWANNQCRAKTVNPCTGITQCSHYTTSQNCTADSCSVPGDCEWRNNQCSARSSTSPSGMKLLDEACTSANECRSNLCQGGKCSLPGSFDWRNVHGNNWITPVKNQLSGDCSIFSSLGVMEAKYRIQQNNPNLNIDLSEEYLGSCCSGAGCGGSLRIGNAYTCLKNGGVTAESCMPYKGNCGTCPTRCSDGSTLKVWKITGFQTPKYTTKEELQKAVIQYGPIGILFYSSTSSSGRKAGDGCSIQRCSQKSTAILGFYTGDHYVSIVGYYNPGKYWVIKNSHGTDKDCRGFIYLDYDSCSFEKGSLAYIEGVIPPA